MKKASTLWLLLTVVNSDYINAAVYFRDHPVSQDVAVGRQDVEFSCEVSPPENPRQDVRLSWIFNGRPIELEQLKRYTIQKRKTKSSLKISRVQRSDAGKYQCLCKLDNIISNAAFLIVHYVDAGPLRVLASEPKTLDNKVSRNSVKFITLQCGIKGEPTPSISFFRNDLLISSASIRSSINISGAEIVNGMYWCEGENVVGKVNSTIDNLVLNLSPDPDRPDGLARLDPAADFKSWQAYKEGADARLTCPFNKSTVQRVDWFKFQFGTSTPVDLSFFKYELEEDDTTLVIKKYIRDDVALYVCSGVSVAVGGGEERKQKFSIMALLAYLDEFEGPWIVNTDQNSRKVTQRTIYVLNNPGLSITCKLPRGLPKPSYWWTNVDGKKIPSATPNLKKLLMPLEHINQAGQYSCHASNIARKEADDIVVNFLVEPRIISPPKHENVKLGQNVTFSCKGMASKKFGEIHWYKDNLRLPRMGREYHIKDIVTTDLDGEDTSAGIESQLNLIKVSRVAAGGYSCKVLYACDNKKECSPGGFPLPKITSKEVPPAELTIEGKFSFHGMKKIYRIPVSDKKLTIKCAIAPGLTGYTISWDRDKRHNVQNVGDKLHFDPPRVNSTGNYTCLAKKTESSSRDSSRSSLETHTFTVVVIFYEPSKFVIAPVDRQVIYGEPAWIDCTASGIPPPLITWDRNYSQIQLTPAYLEEKDYVIFPNKTLLIRRVTFEDDGEFGCSVTQFKTTNRSSFRLTVIRGEGRGMGQTVVIAVGSAAGYLLLVICMALYCKLRRIRLGGGAGGANRRYKGDGRSGAGDGCPPGGEMKLMPDLLTCTDRERQELLHQASHLYSTSAADHNSIAPPHQHVSGAVCPGGGCLYQPSEPHSHQNNHIHQPHTTGGVGGLMPPSYTSAAGGPQPLAPHTSSSLFSGSTGPPPLPGHLAALATPRLVSLEWRIFHILIKNTSVYRTIKKKLCNS